MRPSLVRLATAVSGLALTAVSVATAPAAVADSKTPALSTVQDTRAAMRGEGFAHAAYLLYADEAAREGHGRIAELYRSTAQTEFEDHFTQEAGLISYVGSNEANIRQAMEGERFEATSMYPTYAEEARQDGDVAAAELFTEIAADEAEHRELLALALKALTTGEGKVPSPPQVDPVTVPAGLPQVASARTRANLDDAMHGEGLANATYLLYAQHARDTGERRLAALFEGLAEIELREHFAAEALLAGLVSDTASNLRTSVAGETYEAEVMYPAFARRAENNGDVQAAELFTEIAADEAGHAEAFQRALNHLG
ncbi:ferritin family protein [Streptomyces xiamenensis]|uniref:ferritin family protein n=1 Tax=Streptomyces xiamenensis TaxID=408015 RepID=UPI0036C52260